MPTNRNLRSVAAALMAMAMTVLLLAACPRADVDHSSALGDPFDVPATIAPGPAAEDLGKERSHAVRASRSRERDAAAARNAAAIARLEQAKRDAEKIQRQAAAVIEAPRPVAPAVMDGAFWRRLANCESADGNGGNGGGFFQFSPDTARKVGYRPGMSYETQRGLAESWLARIGGPSKGGTRSGWPHCWWVALRG